MNKLHPEQQDDELYMGNYPKPVKPGEERFYISHMSSGERIPDRPGWKNSRSGLVAYDIHGKVLSNSIPWFTKRSDIEKEIERLKAEKPPTWEDSVKNLQQLLSHGRIL